MIVIISCQIVHGVILTLRMDSLIACCLGSYWVYSKYQNEKWHRKLLGLQRQYKYNDSFLDCETAIGSRMTFLQKFFLINQPSRCFQLLPNYGDFCSPQSRTKRLKSDEVLIVSSANFAYYLNFKSCLDDDRRVKVDMPTDLMVNMCRTAHSNSRNWSFPSLTSGVKSSARNDFKNSCSTNWKCISFSFSGKRGESLRNKSSDL